jgi:hypothetical protein
LWQDDLKAFKLSCHHHLAKISLRRPRFFLFDCGPGLLRALAGQACPRWVIEQQKIRKNSDFVRIYNRIDRIKIQSS